MRLNDLFESKNWQDIDDPADRWLAKYTYENLDKWPSRKIIDTLLNRYPASPGTIYRGMNFDTKEQYDAFVAELPSMQTQQITSWTKRERAAEQFALTKPTYFLDLSVMKSYEKQQQERESLSGYRGLVLSTVIGERQGIDVDQSNLGHESEIILTPGQYDVKVHKVIKRHQETLADSNKTPDEIIMNAKTEAELQSDFVQYVLHHAGKTLKPETQNHVFKLITPAGPLMRRRSDQYGTGYGFSPYLDHLLYLMESGVLRDLNVVGRVRKIAAHAFEQVLSTLRDDFMTIDPMSLRAISRVAIAAGMQPQLIQVAKDVAAPIYQTLNRPRRVNDRHELENIKNRLSDVISRISICCRK